MPSTGAPTPLDRLWGLVRLRCPVCRKAPIFGGALTMHAQCPNCRYVFEREPGYFLGAIAIGYFLGVALIAGFAFGVRTAFPDLDWEWCFVIGAVLYLPFTPTVFRYARGAWMYIDNILDPPAP